MAYRYGDDYVTAESLAEAILLAVLCLDSLREDEEIATVEFVREGNQLIYPGWFVKVETRRTIGSSRWKRTREYARRNGYRLILEAANLAHGKYPGLDWKGSDCENIDPGRRVGLCLP